MKTLFAFILFSGLSFSVMAQSKFVTTSFKVSGNCSMCKKRIEAALVKPGIRQAVWDVKTKMLQVTYNNEKISEQQIHETVAGAGHDTDKVKAKDEVYADLPFCCLYRDHDHSGMIDNR
jgi:copper chaperone CopZ